MGSSQHRDAVASDASKSRLTSGFKLFEVCIPKLTISEHWLRFRACQGSYPLRFPLPLSPFRISNLRQESCTSPQCPRSYPYLIDFKELSGASQLRARADAAQKPMSLIRQAEKASHGKLQGWQNESNQRFPKWNDRESAAPSAHNPRPFIVAPRSRRPWEQPPEPRTLAARPRQSPPPEA